MTNTNETIADIVAEMRFHGQLNIDAEKDKSEYGFLTMEGKIALSFADRLEAAHKREKATAEKSSTVGNMAAMREALEAARDLLLPQCNGGTAFAKACGETVNKIMDALAAPPRNCDVGTADEQTRRMDAEYCYVQKSCYESPSGRECPLHKAGVDCRLIWAQMPYKEGEIR